MSKESLCLCKEHRQEWKQSQYDSINCDYCKLVKEVERLQREIRVLRQYGNKDCTAMADEALMRGE